MDGTKVDPTEIDLSAMMVPIVDAAPGPTSDSTIGSAGLNKKQMKKQAKIQKQRAAAFAAQGKPLAETAVLGGSKPTDEECKIDEDV